MVCAYTNGEVSTSALLRRMKRVDVSCVSPNWLPFIVKGFFEDGDPDTVPDPGE